MTTDNVLGPGQRGLRLPDQSLQITEPQCLFNVLEDVPFGLLWGLTLPFSGCHLDLGPPLPPLLVVYRHGQRPLVAVGSGGHQQVTSSKGSIRTESCRTKYPRQCEPVSLSACQGEVAVHTIQYSRLKSRLIPKQFKPSRKPQHASILRASKDHGLVTPPDRDAIKPQPSFVDHPNT